MVAQQRRQAQDGEVFRQNIAMAAAGFVMAGTIVGAGIGGYALGHHLAPAPVVAPATTTMTRMMGTSAGGAQAAAAPLAITIQGNPSTPGVYQFSPGTITVHAGQKVTLTISNPSAAMHGIAIPAFGVNTMIQPAANGQPSTAQVSFTPTKAGSYDAQCIVYCGPGHARMVLHLKVLA